MSEKMAAVFPVDSGIERDLLEDPALTLLVITHHLSDELAAHYDAVLEMKNGQLVPRTYQIL